MTDDTITQILAEMAARKPAEDAVAVTEAVAAKIRSRFDNHPKQRAFWQSAAKRSAALCTRRAGKSDGGVHEWLAKAITTPGWRGVYINTTRAEAVGIVWRNDLGAGWVDLLAAFGEPVESRGKLAYSVGGVRADINQTELTIDFANGSQIALFGADDEKSIDKLRGRAKDEVWIDEAQKFPHLRALVIRVIDPLLKDKKGVLRLTGTPSHDCAGYFYDVTVEPDDGSTPIEGWEVHRWSVVDNPAFGATEDERWQRTAGDALRNNGWDGTEPDFIREWLGKWVKTDARYVYPVHGVPQHVLVYAPQRLIPNPIMAEHKDWLDVETARRDLPRASGREHEWMFAIGADFGYAETPFALTVWAFTFDLPDIFELGSWKQHKVLPDDQRQYIEHLWNALPNIVALAGDPAGQKSADLEAWRTRFSLPIDDADKSAKNTWQELMAGDIRKGHVHYREGSPLLHEHTHLVYLPTKPGKTRKDDEFRRLSDGTVPGNDCFVAGTLVRTARGDEPIERIVEGDYVWTRLGLRRVTIATPTRCVETFDLELEDGTVLTGTGDHKIMTPDGWTRLRDLTPDATVIKWANTDHTRQSSFRADGIDGIRTDQPGRRGCTSRERESGTVEHIASFSIARSGNPSTAKSHAGCMSITSTETRSITRSRTSHSWMGASTLVSMRVNHDGSITHVERSRSPYSMLPSGIAQQKAALGTSSTANAPWSSDRWWIEPALFVPERSEPSSRTPRRAVTSAERRNDVTADSMTSTARANGAVPSSGETDTVGVLRTARSRVRCVRPTGRVEQTYDLSVDGAHEFFANGVLVANCADAGLYAYRYMQHHLFRDRPKDARDAGTKQADEYQKQLIEAHAIRQAIEDYGTEEW